MENKMLTLENIDQILGNKKSNEEYTGILNDRQIKELCEKGMITPFWENLIKEETTIRGPISYGLSSFGYDVTLGSTVKLFKKPSLWKRLLGKNTLDPKDFDQSVMKILEIKSEPNGNFYRDCFVLLPPYSFALGHTVEIFDVPEDVMCLCTCKSTLARIGLNVNSTTFEPGFKGQITMELTNPTPYVMKIYLEGIAQVLFFKGLRPKITYKDKKGKYQGQTAITTAKV